MLEFARTRAALICCLAEPTALDAMPVPPDACLCRIAPDELMLLGRPLARDELLRHGSQAVATIAVDHTDAWSVWTIFGPDAPRAMSRLTANRLPAGRTGFMQGAIVSLPARALLLADRVVLLVSASVGHHLRERILEDCADLEPWELEPTDFEPAPLGRPAEATVL